MTAVSRLWRSAAMQGHEYARLRTDEGAPALEGVALFVHERRPCRLDYRIECTGGWLTRRVVVSGWVGDARVDVLLEASGTGEWRCNGVPMPAVHGCLDVDLNFSPSTNTLPIRRLRLKQGEKQALRAAWLRFPSFQLESLPQSYTRLGEDRYLYESGDGRFQAELTVDDAGLVRDYGDLWIAR